MRTSSCWTNTLAECDRVSDGRADYSHKLRRHGANVPVATDSDGQLLWLSPALPGRSHDLTAADTHRIIRICKRQGVPIPADLAYQSGGPWVTTGIKRQPLQELPHREDPQPGPGRGTGTGRARRRTSEVLAHLPQILMQSEPHDVNYQSRPHPGAATMKRLTHSLRLPVREISARQLSSPGFGMAIPASQTNRCDLGSLP